MGEATFKNAFHKIITLEKDESIQPDEFKKIDETEVEKETKRINQKSN